MKDKFELIYQTEAKKRIYKLPCNITKGINGKLIKPTQYVLVSDATSFDERLVFPVWLQNGIAEEDARNGKDHSFSVYYVECEGTTTNPLNGGDASTIEPDENYLTRLVEMQDENDLGVKAE